MNVREPRENTFDRILAVLSVPLSVVFAMALVATIDAACLPSREFGRSFLDGLTALGSMHRDAFRYLGIAGAWALFLTAAPVLRQIHRGAALISTALVIGVSTGLAHNGYERLLLDPIFAGFLPGALAWAAAGVYFAVAFSLTHVGKARTRAQRVLRMTVLLTSALGSIAGLVLNQLYLPRLYPSFHLALAFGLVVVITHASSGFVIRAFDLGHKLTLRVWSAVLLVVALLSLVLFLVGNTPRAEAMAGLVRRYSVLGRAASLYADLSRTRRGTVKRDPQGIERFAAHHALPKLPQDFDLSRYNVLFISSEATRFDQTSLADPELDTTPNLAAFEKRGAFSFSRAYSTSSSTFQVMSAIMTMQYPSMVDMNLAKASWFGTLGREDQTVAELFRNAGYATLRITHNHTHSFDRNMIGLGRGFQITRLIDSPEYARQTDRRIMTEALKRMRAVPRNQRFFSWVFFVSPHGPYVTHDVSAGTSAIERYRQEIKYMDSQFGELLKGLEADGRLNDTIIVFTGDHGEEFREHGGTLHKQTVYSESIRVPLLIWVPGMVGKRADKPTSLLYVFPWLLLQGTREMRAVVTRNLELKIGPMLKATDGAVIAELLGHDRMESALIYERTKINYDFLTDATELFDVIEDPLEQRNVLADSKERERALSRLRRYREIRAATQRFTYARPTPQDGLRLPSRKTAPTPAVPKPAEVQPNLGVKLAPPPALMPKPSPTPAAPKP